MSFSNFRQAKRSGSFNSGTLKRWRALSKTALPWGGSPADSGSVDDRQEAATAPKTPAAC